MARSPIRHPDDAPRKPGDDAWWPELAKWLAPSVAATLAIIGYVSQSAQEILLGLAPADDGGLKYAKSAGQFLTDSLGSLVQAGVSLFDFKLVALGGHAGLLFTTTVLVGLTFALRLPLAARGLEAPDAARSGPASFLRAAIRWWAKWGALLLLLVLIAAKAWWLDAPLQPLSNIVLSDVVVGEQAQAGDADSHQNIEQRLTAASDSTEPTERIIARRAASVWGDLICSRVGPEANNQQISPGVRDTCRLSRAASLAELRGFFLAQLWLGAAIALCATDVLRRHTGGVAGVSLALLAVLYLLTVPYAHGKLLRSTYFDLGRLRLTSVLAEAAPATDRPPAAAPAAGSGAMVEYGLLLARDASGVSVLTTTSVACPNRNQGAEVTMSSISPSQLLAVDHIYRQDVIAWAFLNTQRCPHSAPPPFGG